MICRQAAVQASTFDKDVSKNLSRHKYSMVQTSKQVSGPSNGPKPLEHKPAHKMINPLNPNLYT